MKPRYKALGLILLLAFCLAAWPALAQDSGDLAGYWKVDDNELFHLVRTEGPKGVVYTGGLYTYEGKRLVDNQSDFPCMCYPTSEPNVYKCYLTEGPQRFEGKMLVRGDQAMFQEVGKSRGQVFSRMRGMDPPPDAHKHQARAKKPEKKDPPPMLELAGFYRVDSNEVVRFVPLKAAVWSYEGRMFYYEKEQGKMVLRPRPQARPILVRQVDPMNYEWKQGDLGQGTLVVKADSIVVKDSKGLKRTLPRMPKITPEMVKQH